MSINKAGELEEGQSEDLIESMKTALPENIARTLVEALAGLRPEDLGRVPVLGEAVLSFSPADLEMLRVYIHGALEQVHKDLFEGKKLVVPVCPQPPLLPDARIGEDADAEVTDGLYALKKKQYQVEMQRYHRLKAAKDQLWEDLHVLYTLECELRDCRLEAVPDLEATMLSHAIHTSVIKAGEPSEGEGE
jgi:hypothetical protein